MVLLDGAGTDVLRTLEALAAADRAIDLRPGDEPAVFNRAVILERLGLTSAAASAYRDYLRLDRDSRWAGEARERLQSLERKDERWSDRRPEIEAAAASGDQAGVNRIVRRFPQDARGTVEGELLADWGKHHLDGNRDAAGKRLAVARAMATAIEQDRGEGLAADAVRAILEAIERGDSSRARRLARGHVAYHEGRRLYASREVKGAVRQFDVAVREFQAARSPMELLAAYYRADAVTAGAISPREALGTLQELTRRAPSRYRALRGYAEWLRGSIAWVDGMPEGTLKAYTDAAGIFAAIGESSNVIDLRSRTASILAILGRTPEAWTIHADLIAVASSQASPQSLARTLYLAASDAVREERWGVASALLGVAAEVRGANPGIRAQILSWWPLAARRAGMTRTVEEGLRRARESVSQIPDATLRLVIENDLRLVEALVVRDRDPGRSARLVSEFLPIARETRRTVNVPHALMERAAAHRSLGRLEEAKEDLRTAIAAVEEARGNIARDEFRDAFFGRSSAAYSFLAELLEDGGDVNGAVAVLDRRRARVILDRISGTRSAAGPGGPDRLPPLDARTAILSYGIYPDKVTVFVHTARGLRHFRSAASAATLARTSAAFGEQLRRGNIAGAREQGRALHRFLIEPALPSLGGIDTLVVVSEPALHRVAFPALVQPDGRYLIESFTIAMAPSIASYALVREAPGRRPSMKPLVVGNPRLDPVRFAAFPPLLAAEEEARDVAASYAGATLLVRDAATKTGVVEGLRQCDVAHLAAHAVVDPADAQRSRILLAAAAHDDGVLETSEITALHLDRLRLVVLAGCRTGALAEGYGDLRSLAAAFLVAGARSVVATLWDVDDETTREISVLLHREIARGAPSMQALRQAQLRMLRSTDPRMRNPQAWAALQIYGSGE
ncbi:MAG TPA: CHAT domain-containing protein [Thermoanaerobaculia bacterium]|nr:CHAT domain-containing protein [Thermoanaerobaculia bacterium]